MCATPSRSSRLSAATTTLGLAAGTRSPFGRAFASDSLRVNGGAPPLRHTLPAIARSDARILRALALIDSPPEIFGFPTLAPNTIPYHLWKTTLQFRSRIG